jgi:hemerythrin-like domain-containing protein
MPPTNPTITETLITEHAVFLAIFDQVEQLLAKGATLPQVRMLANLVEGLLRAHGEKEQNLVYLALDHVQAEHEESDRLYQDHREIDERLQQVHSAADAAHARRLLRAALTASREHFAWEEEAIFPLAEQRLSAETLRALEKASREEKAVAA